MSDHQINGGSNGSSITKSDKYGIVDLGFRLKSFGESLMQTGRIADKIEGSQLSIALLAIERELRGNESLSIEIRSYLRDLAHKVTSD